MASSKTASETGLGKAAWILSLIGGILGLMMSLFFIFFGFFLGAVIASIPVEAGEMPANPMPPDFFLVLFGFIGVYLLATAGLTILGSVWMRDSAKQMKGSIIVLVCSLLGGGTIFGLVGGILGLVDHSQKNEKKR
ncbi:DUF4064 domain-containing protein [Candidatus Woesearchaeota archaeon]|nr:DUF4064 domain-containing protein [Candidatus Woesearchaeota archaeon]